MRLMRLHPNTIEFEGGPLDGLTKKVFYDLDDEHFYDAHGRPRGTEPYVESENYVLVEVYGRFGRCQWGGDDWDAHIYGYDEWGDVNYPAPARWWAGGPDDWTARLRSSRWASPSCRRSADRSVAGSVRSCRAP